jgi:hypothetical protein
VGIDGTDAKTYPVGEKFLLPRWEVLLNGERIKRASRMLIMWEILVIIMLTTQARKLPKREHLGKFHFIHVRLNGDLEM